MVEIKKIIKQKTKNSKNIDYVTTYYRGESDVLKHFLNNNITYIYSYLEKTHRILNNKLYTTINYYVNTINKLNIIINSIYISYKLNKWKLLNYLKIMLLFVKTQDFQIMILMMMLIF